MSTRYEVIRFTPDMTDAAATLLAERHRRHRLTCPALNPAFEDPAKCATLIAEALDREGSLGAVAFADRKARGYVLMTEREEMWGPNAWAEGRARPVTAKRSASRTPISPVISWTPAARAIGRWCRRAT